MSIEEWLPQARQEYDPHGIHEGLGVVTQTRFGPFLGLLVENDFKTLIKTQRPNILIVGPGGDSELGYMPYELYELTAYLQFHGFDYDLTVVDIKPEIIEKVQTRRHMGIFMWDLIAARADEMFDDFSWPTYCQFVNHQPQDRNNQEVFWAPIPQTLAAKLESGVVKLETSDVTQVQLPTDEYNLVICRNVLYQLDGPGRKLAYFNLAQSMKAGSLLWTNYGMIINPSFVKDDRQEALLQQDWFLDLHLDKGPILGELNGIPMEYSFRKV